MGVEVVTSTPISPTNAEGYPIGAAPTTGSATGAASAITASIPATPSRFSYLTGFEVTGAGATGASVITVTVTGTVTGTLNYKMAIPAGVTTAVPPLIVEFPVAIPANAVNTAITVNVPSFGAGNTDAAVTVHGFLSSF